MRLRGVLNELQSYFHYDNALSIDNIGIDQRVSVQKGIRLSHKSLKGREKDIFVMDRTVLQAWVCDFEQLDNFGAA